MYCESDKNEEKNDFIKTTFRSLQALYIQRNPYDYVRLVLQLLISMKNAYLPKRCLGGMSTRKQPQVIMWPLCTIVCWPLKILKPNECKDSALNTSLLQILCFNLLGKMNATSITLSSLSSLSIESINQGRIGKHK